MPGLKAAEIDGRLEDSPIDKVLVMCVNDAAVMQAWKKDQGLLSSEMIEFIADKDADVTNACGIKLTLPEARALFDKFDYDGGRTVSLDEMRRAFRDAAAQEAVA